MTPNPSPSYPIHIAAFYHFVDLPDFRDLKDTFLHFGKQHRLRGMVLLAQEGINGTVSGDPESIDLFEKFIFSDSRLQGAHFKKSFYHRHPFFRLKVRLKKEIVTLGNDNFSIHSPRGTYVEPKDWNALISRPDIRVIDTRNDYEIKMGTFKNAINPATDSFREFPDFVLSTLSQDKKSPIAMTCTGGIRCEKASQFLKSLGFEEVYHLKGGILKYLEEIPESESLWEGSCFVFDQRVSVRHELVPTNETLCYGCRNPLTSLDKNSPQFEEGVSCPSCFSSTSPEQKSSFRQRHHQMEIARQRGFSHMGPQKEDLSLEGFPSIF